MKVLVVDDHPFVREGLKAALRTAQPECDVAEAESASEALEQSATQFDLILLDLNLRDTDRADPVSIVVKMSAARPGVPIIVVSADEDPARIWQAMQAGACGYFTKSMPPEALMPAVRCVLARGIYLPAFAVRALEPLVRPAASPTVKPDLADPLFEGLTDRQIQVALLAAQAKPYKIIARELGISDGTIKAHLSAVYKTLGIANREQLILMLERHRYSRQAGGSSWR
ncbi:MAG: response regulator [Betaproteobacteria bacterium]